MEQWRKQLIDLTPRNPLLYSSPRRRRLVIIDPPLSQLWSSLFEKEESFVLVPEDWTEDAQPFKEEPDLSWEEQLAHLLQQPRWARYPQARIAGSSKIFQSTLIRLRRRVRTLYEDAGFWTLFLAFGLLRWKPTPRPRGTSGPTVWESPLILLPINLEQKSLGDPILLTLRQDEEVQFNLALWVYLQDVEKMSLPQVNPENLTETLEAVAHAVKERGWIVEPVCWLNLFSFHKMAIYRDLKDNEDLIIRHPIVQALAGVTRPDLSISIAIDRNTLDARPSTEIATVLSADSSQLEAVLRAREGESFWIHGPPGTGKSQTIVNIIADALARGKSVLFVSEKRAALEVVLRRLREVHLEPFCLDLHNYRVRRRDVVKAVVEEMKRGWQPKSPVSTRLPADLNVLRKALANYVKAIHTIRTPLNRTPYQVIGRISRLPNVQVQQEIALDMASLTENKLAEIVHLAHSLVPTVDIAREGVLFPWIRVQVDSFSEQVRMDLLSRIKKIRRALDSLASVLDELCSPLGLRPPSTVQEARELHSLLEAFQELPPLPLTWSRKRDVQDWLARARDALSSLREFIETREKLAPFMDTTLLPADGKGPLSIKEVRAVQEAVEVLSSSRVLKEVLNQPLAILLDHRPLLQDLSDALERADQHARALRFLLGLDAHIILDDVRRTVSLARALKRGLPLEPGWLKEKDFSQAFDRARYFLDLLAEWRELRRKLLRDWKEDFLNLDVTHALVVWQRWHRNLFRFLWPPYQHLAKRLRRIFRVGKPSQAQVTRALRALDRLQNLQALLDKLHRDPNLIRFLGRYYKGLETDPLQTLEALTLARGVRDAFPAGLPLRVRRLLLGQTEMAEEQAAIVGDLLDAWADWTDSAEVLSLLKTGLLAQEEPLGILIQDLKNIQEALGLLVDFWERLTPLFKGKISVTGLAPSLEILSRCLEAREHFQDVAGALVHEWAWGPEAYPQAWEDVLSALEIWTKLAVRTDGVEDVPDPLAHAARNPQARPSPKHLAEALQGWEQAFQDLKQLFGHPFPLIQGEIPFSEAKFDILAEHLHHMENRVDDVQRYLDLLRFRKALEAYLSPSVVNTLLVTEDLSPKDLPQVVERIVLSRWLDYVFSSDPLLQNFRRDRHEQYLEKFRQLDKGLQVWASAWIVEELNEKRSSLIESSREVQIIRREAQKLRRHLSIRRIIQKTFHTMLAVKPCWLMSPLSVSRFLLPDHQFDLVIFDEASQVRPEDAIPAIYRAKQVIICGDPKQLPPTSFFQRHFLDTLPDEEEQDEGEDALYRPEGQSVLEILQGALPSVFLRWHYRSKDEKLIAFSAYYIYEGSLITFPTPQTPNSDTGVEYHYLPNAIYERGGRRVNRAEVEEVCHLVMDHLEKWGTSRTLGVVTMNEPQMHAILDELERRSRQDPKLRVLWEETKWNSGEAFFVKNLEAVQGDERDVIIISTTYGRGPDGRRQCSSVPSPSQAGSEDSMC